MIYIPYFAAGGAVLLFCGLLALLVYCKRRSVKKEKQNAILQMLAQSARAVSHLYLQSISVFFLKCFNY